MRACIVLDGGLPAGQAANVAACLAAGLGAGVPEFAGQPLRDAAGLRWRDRPTGCGA